MNNDSEKTYGIWNQADKTELKNVQENSQQTEENSFLSENGDDFKRCMGCMEIYSSAETLCPYCGYFDGEDLESPMHLQPGTRLNERYIMGKSIGSGGFGVTYVAWDSVLNTKVAIKEYLPGEFSTRSVGQSHVTVFSGDKTVQFEDGKEKFFDEAKKLVKFQNESGIVKVFDCFKENHTAYIVMEYLEGETLESYLKREGKIDSETAIDMMLPVIESLEKVHEEGILHRDVSPDNIFLTADGKVKLLDFGAARYATTSKSRSLSILIKQGYSAEEQYRSRGDQGPHTDVYSVGATLYKMVTGETPPDALVRRVKYEKSGKDMLTPIGKFSEDITGNHESAIYNAMNVRIEDRTPDMKTFKAELISETKVKRRKGTIKKTDIFKLPLWLKISVPIVVVLFVILGLLLAFGVIGPRSGMNTKYTAGSGEVVVPNVIEMSLKNAQKTISESNLEPLVYNKEVNPKIPYNTIMSQTPKKGKVVSEGESVELIISLGHGEVEVENVIGKSYEEAKKILEDLGFEVDRIEVFDVTRAGYIVSQGGTENKIIEKKSLITLTVSKGLENVDESKTVKVPDLNGMSYDEALKELEKHGLTLSLISTVYEKNRPEGIISQTPASGTVAYQGDYVGVTVNEGERKVAVPDLIYCQKDAAIDMLIGQNLRYEVLEEEYREGFSVGAVYAQSEPKDKLVPENSVITIWVCKKEETAVTTQRQTQPETEWYSVTEEYIPEYSTATYEPSTAYEPTTIPVLTVYFDANGGTVSFKNRNVEYGNTTSFPIPTREGYRFDGWFTAKSGGREIKSGTPIETNLYLYAHWTAQEKSDWVNIENVPAEYLDDIVETRWTYDKSTVKSEDKDPIRYAKSFPSGYKADSPLHNKYNKVKKKSEKKTSTSGNTTTTVETIIKSDKLAGYIYWHWCRGENPTNGKYDEEDNNRTVYDGKVSTHSTFHEFETAKPVGTEFLSKKYGTKTWKYWDSSVCKDTYHWIYNRVEIYEQKYTVKTTTTQKGLVSSSDPTGQSGVSNVKKQVKYYK